MSTKQLAFKAVATTFIAFLTSTLAFAQLPERQASTTALHQTKDEAFAALDPLYQKIMQASWSVSGQSIQQLGLSKDDAARFLDMLKNNHSKIALNAADYPDPDKLARATIGDFKFVDVDGDGVLELIVSVNYTDKNSFDDVYVIHRAYDYYKFDMQRLRAYNITSLDGVVTDVDGDGHNELVVTELMTSGRAGEPQVVYPAVFVFSHGDWQDQSENFPAYYTKTVIPQLDKQIADMTARGAAAIDVQVIQLARDKAFRLSGGVFAGLFDAQWRSNSPISQQRLLAVAVLRDIALQTNSNQATIYLFYLTRDWDFNVAMDARLALQDVSFKYPHP